MIDRRGFIGLTTSALASVSRGSLANQHFGAARSDDEFGKPLKEISYRQVSLSEGLHQSQLEETHDILMGLNEDSLLRPYRVRSGLPAPSCDLSGWYGSPVFGGETFGQWLSALSRYYAISGDEGTRQKVLRLMQGFAQTVDTSGQIFGDPKVTTGPSYHYDKLVCGLMDAHQFAQAPGALNVLANVTRVAKPLLPGYAVDFKSSDAGAHESYTLPENQFIAWQRGGIDEHLSLAKSYLYHQFFDPLSRGENILGGRHAYSHVNSLCSAAKAYLVLGDARYLRAAQNGFKFLEEQSFSTGAWGPNETLLPAEASPWYNTPDIRSLGESLTHSHSHFETPCGSYAHFKLTRYLLRITKDSAYGDSMERVMYNTILGAKPLQADGRAFYQSDYNADGHKRYYDGDGGKLLCEWPCCSGTLPQVVADYRLCTYFQDAGGAYVNLFIPSTFTWLQGDTPASLTQTGTYPLGDQLSFEVTLPRPVEFEMRLRIPGWATGARVSINGMRSVAPTPGSFARIRREWRHGDRLELELPHSIQLKAVDAQHPDLVAVCYGPLVLFTLCAETPQLSRRDLLTARREGTTAEWSVGSRDSSRLRLVPFWSITGSERYSTYLPVV